MVRHKAEKKLETNDRFYMGLITSRTISTFAEKCPQPHMLQRTRMDW